MFRLTTFYCWTCEHEIKGIPVEDTHYETGRLLRFCDAKCHEVYRWLKAL